MAMPTKLKRVNPEWVTYFRAAHSDHADYRALYGAGWVESTPQPLIE